MNKNDPIVYASAKSAMLFLVIELGDVFFRKLPGPPTPRKISACFHFFSFSLPKMMMSKESRNLSRPTLRCWAQ